MNNESNLRTPTASRYYLDNWLRYQAQSVLTGIVKNPELPSLEEARDILSWAAKARARKKLPLLKRILHYIRISNP